MSDLSPQSELKCGIETNGGTDANGEYSEEEVARMAHTLAVKAVTST